MSTIVERKPKKAPCPHCKHKFSYPEATKRTFKHPKDMKREPYQLTYCPKCDKRVIWTQTLVPVAGKVRWVQE
jgi:endogenous inhibitor of DNA gyrase (YacG/DUF329 family)